MLNLLLTLKQAFMRLIFKCIIFCILVFQLFIGCNKSHTGELSIITINGAEIADVNLESMKDPINISLSQIADNVHIVALETDSDCLISSQLTYNIDDQYVLICEISGIYQFSSNGD